MAQRPLLCMCLQWVICAAQILIAIAVIVITAVKLSKGSYVYTSLDFTTGEVTVERRHAQCFLSTSQDSDRACISMFILSGVSIAVSIALSCIYQMCCCLRYTCFCDFVDFVFAAAGFSWWLGGSVVMTRVVQSADAANVPQHYWRQDIMALIWSEVGLFALLLFAYFGTLLSNCCCCFDKQARLRSRARPVEERYQLAEHL